MIELNRLRDEIRKHDLLYTEGNPIITDTEYDELYRKLTALEEAHPETITASSPTQKITPTAIDKIIKSKHRAPMVSLADVNTPDKIIKFIEGEKEILAQDKLDGITIVLTYNNGALEKAVTRGNGLVGDNVIHNIQQIDNIPKTIPYNKTLEARGEIVLPYKAFDKLNSLSNNAYSNPRNTVAGAIRRLDSTHMQGVGYEARMFNLEYIEDRVFDTDLEKMDFLSTQGFDVVKSYSFSANTEKGQQELLDFMIDYEQNTRATLPYMIDGIVFKVNDLNRRKELGTTSKFPKWALAYKFKAIDATTTLTEVISQVGKSGQITPVAVFEEVTIDDVNITRATLNNYNVIKIKDIRINDTIVVERANDVIPKITKSIASVRKGTEEIIVAPTHCPVCGSETKFEGANLYCLGLKCQPQLEGKLTHFASRDAMNIDGLGQKTITTFYQAGIISSITDIYELAKKKDEIVNAEGFGEVSYERITSGVEKSKQQKFENVLYGLSIHNVGRRASKDLAKTFTSLTSMLELSEDPLAFKEQLLQIQSFGEALSTAVVDFFNVNENRNILNKLIELGLPTTQEPIEDLNDTFSPINGKTFVVTGKVTMYGNRKELSNHIEQLGGSIVNTVSKNTNYLINNDTDSPSSKNKKALKLGIPILSEQDFLNLL